MRNLEKGEIPSHYVWKPPIKDWIKFNFDDALDEDGNATSACLIWNKKGDVLGWRIERELVEDASIAEPAAVC